MSYPRQAPAPVPQKTSGMAIAALILGLLSFCLGPLTGIAAAICGFIALAKIAHNPAAKGRGLALTGAITGIAGTVLIIVAVFFAAVVGPAILIPSLGRARMLAERNRQAMDMQMIVVACESYEVDSASFPPHLAVLIANGAVSPKSLVGRGETPARLPVGLAPGDWRSIAANIDAHCDLVYVGADAPGTGDSSIIVLYAKPPAPEGRNVAFADGRVQFVKNIDLPRIFDECNRARARAKLPPITLDVPPPPPP